MTQDEGPVDQRELLEDAGLVAAIEEGQKTEMVERERIFELLTSDERLDG